MPVAMISTRSSPSFGPSRSSSTISSGCLGAKATAARVFIGALRLGFAVPYSFASRADKTGSGLEEAPDPPADPGIVVRLVERFHRRLGIGHFVIPLGN